MQLTCKTSGSKPAADIRWFKNDKEIKGKGAAMASRLAWVLPSGGATAIRGGFFASVKGSKQTFLLCQEAGHQ